jgi:hypothetical protein
METSISPVIMDNAIADGQQRVPRRRVNAVTILS